MLSWRRRVSLPAPGRHSGRIPEWHTDTRTDIRTVVQQAVGAGPPQAACWDEEAGTGAGGAQPPELRAMSRTPEAGWGWLKPRGGWDCCPLLRSGLFGPPVFGEGAFLRGQVACFSSPRKFFHFCPSWAPSYIHTTGSAGVRLLFMSGKKRHRETSNATDMRETRKYCKY